MFIRSQMVTVIEHGRQSQPKFLEALSLNSVSPGRAAPAGAVRSGPTPLISILAFAIMLVNVYAYEISDDFLLLALWGRDCTYKIYI